MLIRIGLLAVWACLAVGCTGESGANSSEVSPEQVVEQFIQAEAENDFNTIKKLLVESEAKMPQPDETWVSRGKIESTEVGSASVDGDEAQVPVTFTTADGTEVHYNYACRREDGEWRVSLMDTNIG